MKTKKEIRDWILENCVNEYGNIYLVELDFSDFDGDVYISGMKVKNELFQSYQEVGGKLCQRNQTVAGDLEQYGQTVKGYVKLGMDDFAGIKEWDWRSKEWEITKEINPYKDMSKEQLIEIIKELEKKNKA